MIQEIWPKCVPTPDHRTKLSAQVTPGILSNHSLCPKCIAYACDLFYAGILFKYNTVIKSVRNVEQGKECERCCFIDACGSSQIQKGGSRPKIFDQTHRFINLKKSVLKEIFEDILFTLIQIPSKIILLTIWDASTAVRNWPNTKCICWNTKIKMVFSFDFINIIFGFINLFGLAIIHKIK